MKVETENRGSTLRLTAFDGSQALRLLPQERDWTDADGTALEFARSVVNSEAQAIMALEWRLDSRFCEAVSLVLECGGCVVTTGMGKAGHIARKVSATLASTGSPSHFVHPGEAYHGDLGAIRPGDVVVAFSYSGESEEVKRILEPLTSRNIPIIAICSTQNSSLGRAATAVLELGRVEEADALRLAPSSSAAAMLAMGDALALTASRLRGFRSEDFARFHPGGALGRSLCRVRELMRPLSLCRVARDSMTLREVFVSCRKSGRRTGAVMLVDESGRLSGIFTDSDLSRLVEDHREDCFDRPASEVMTKTPLAISVDAMMTEAATIFKRRHISELPALDADGRPVGLVDVVDLTDFLPSADNVRRTF